ncbi:MAG: 4-oxalomesaconate tautomerase [Mycobacterium sp.]|nr:4-oxalomesaconate tautomerase [Mycobacterium sp.]
MISLRAMMMRGGTSKGVYLLKSDLDGTGLDPNVLLPAIMGSPDRRQIDGLGGGSSTTSKVAIVGPSSRPDCDIDYLFAQVDVATMRVDWTPTCGNLLTGVGPFAIERGMVAAADRHTVMRVYLVNTGATVIVSVPTPGGCVSYEGGWEISGVPGRAAPIDTVFSDFCGGRTGTLFPTGKPVDHVGGVTITAIDAGVCAVIAQAGELGVAGDESPQQLNNDRAMLERLESLRRRAALAMGLGDVRGCVLPKVMLVSKSGRGDIRSRYFVPDSCHPTHAVSGAICLATAATVRETVVARLLARPFQAGPIAIEHPAGSMSIEITRPGAGLGLWAAARSTARKLFDGYVFADLSRKAG